jgi:hypothetical protein
MLALGLLFGSRRGRLVRRCDISTVPRSGEFHLLSIGTAWEAKQVSVPHEVGEELETRYEYRSDPC